MTQLSRYFTLQEMTVSETAARRGLSNKPSAKALENLKRLCALLDEVREELGHPILVSSGYRSPEVNAAVGGSKTSAHCQGLAVDFTCPGVGSPLEVARRIAAMGLEFDQLIHEFGTWVHLGLRDDAPRRQLLTIDRRGTRAGLA